MRLDPNPLFRKVITPWYDGKAACRIVLAAMLVVILFSLSGIVTARSDPDFYRHTWVPLAMLGLSLLVVVSILLRLFQRSDARSAQTREL